MTELMLLLRKLLTLALLTVLVVGSTICGIWLERNRQASTKLTHLGPTVVELEKLGELTTMRVHVTDVLIAEGEGHRGSWLIKGDALLSCDMSQARILDRQPANRTATISLPSPRIITARVDHEKTKTWSVEKTTWLPWKWGDSQVLRDSAMFHAQQLVEAAAGTECHLDHAKTQAESLIRQTYQLVEWTVTVEWQ